MGMCIFSIQRLRADWIEKFALSSDCSAFQAEVFAMFKASEYILSVGLYLQVPNLRIVSDNQSAIKAIANPMNKKLLALNTRFNLLTSPIPIKLQWVKAHQNDNFNNEVDLLAKQTSLMTDISYERCSKSHAVSQIKSVILNQYFVNYEKKPKKYYSDGFFVHPKTVGNIYDKQRQLFKVFTHN